MHGDSLNGISIALVVEVPEHRTEIEICRSSVQPRFSESQA